MSHESSHPAAPGVSILEKLNLLAWLAFLLFTVGLVYGSRSETAVTLGFPLFCALALWSIHVSFETRAAEQRRGWLYVAVIIFGGMIFSILWFRHLYQALMH